IALRVELPARVKHRHHDLGRRLTLLLVHVDRDSATVVGNRHRIISMDHHVDPRARAGQRLIDRIIDNFPDKVMQTYSSGGADVHRGALPHGLQIAKHLDAVSVVPSAGLHNLSSIFVPHNTPYLQTSLKTLNRTPPLSRSAPELQSDTHGHHNIAVPIRLFFGSPELPRALLVFQLEQNLAALPGDIKKVQQVLVIESDL